MNQIEIGQFISERRREKELTQKQLAEQLGVTDKTISKWETGRCMPDAVVLFDLCKILEMDIHELLAGKPLGEEEYTAKAEENLVGLIEELNVSREKSRGRNIGTIAGIVLTFLACVLMVISLTGVDGLLFYIDMSTFLCVFGFTIFVVSIAGYFRGYKNAFLLGFAGKRMVEKEVHFAIQTMRFTCLLTLAMGGLSFAAGVIAVLMRLNDVSTIGPSLAVMVLSLVYTAVLEILYLILLFRIKLVYGRNE